MTLHVVGDDGLCFDDWYEEARPRVLATLTVVCGDLDAAAEATDEAFLRALARWGSVRSMASPVGWTVRVAINVARRRARRRQLEHRVLRREVGPTHVAAAAGELWHLVAALPTRQREVIVLRYIADLEELAIAQVLGVSRSAVSSALTDARRRLGTDLRAETDAPAAPVGRTEESRDG